MPLSYRELTTILTTTMTTVRLLDTPAYTATKPHSCLVARLACANGSEGWGFESLRAHPGQGRFPSLRRRRHWFFDDSFGDLMGGPGTRRPIVRRSGGHRLKSSGYQQ